MDTNRIQEVKSSNPDSDTNFLGGLDGVTRILLVLYLLGSVSDRSATFWVLGRRSQFFL